MAKDKTTVSISETAYSSETRVRSDVQFKKCHTSCLSHSCDPRNDGYKALSVFSRFCAFVKVVKQTFFLCLEYKYD